MGQIQTITSYSIALILLAGLALLVSAFTSKRKGTSRLTAKPLLSRPEQTLYWRLVNAFPNNTVLAQVALSQMFKATGGNRKSNFAHYGRVRQKVADFVICDRSFQPLYLIELDDRTHSKKKDRQRDALTSESGLPTIRWRSSALPTEEQIVTDLQSLQSGNLCAENEASSTGPSDQNEADHRIPRPSKTTA